MSDISKLLIAEVSGGVLNVIINRPEKRNALSRAVLAELRRTFRDFAAAGELKVAVLRGAGDRCFAA
ncbi:MAG: enoyl-CoA hydratase/isomerase family protein, partial [Betaproteobacteria bacterium]|nr:enoyl-CoA hydratase/isomerase family protein [Betaproteobacteria bacterium]